ncbi:MAG: glycosyltransferase family 4 protein [Flavobacterium sp.]|uniref:glycosyltransferase family 4 protein n=1 Tax=Flavobacterium sp. TaxID=239 RepID=UPI001AFD5090|nr:glycosyltransferase family 4 protein [Flavobacterium sp.]MBO9584156.1 glycosyltransferase family 4 protein [Flavobacterium sp.]
MIENNLHIGISGPVYLPSLNIKCTENRSNWPTGMGGSPVNLEINALLNRGYKVSVFSLSPEIESDKGFEYHEGNFSIYIGPFRKRVRDRCLDFFKIERNFLKNKINRVCPDVIHAHWQYEWAWGALSSNIPCLVTCHDDPLRILKLNTNLYRFIRFLMAKIVYRKGNYFTTVSPETGKGITRHSKTSIKVIPNFVTKEYFDFNRIREINRGVKIAMINNSFNSSKNVKIGIEAFAEFKKTNIAELHLFGNDHEKGGIANTWAEEKGISEQVYFHGIFSPLKLRQALSDCHILLHTSKEESFGMVLIESMAMGIPVVAGSKSGGIPWVLSRGGGVLVDINNVNDILNGIEKVLSEYNSFSKEARLATKERFSEDVVIDAYIEEIYKVKEKVNG